MPTDRPRRWLWLAAMSVSVLACSRGHRDTAVRIIQGALETGVFVGPESRIDEPVYPDGIGDQDQAFTAVGGPGALVVWREDRDPSSGTSEEPVWAARLDGEGRLLDPVGFRITPASADRDISPWRPIAGWSGDRALVVWATSGSELHAARVTSDGSVLDPVGIDIALGGTSRTDVAVVPSGDGFLILWAEDTVTRFMRVGRDGSIGAMGGTPIALPAEDPTLHLAGAASVDGGVLLVFWSGSPSAWLAKVIKIDASGVVSSPLSGLAGPANVPNPLDIAVASSGATALVLWKQSTADGQPATLFGRRASAAGAWIDAAPIEVRPVGGAIGRIGVVWNGTSFLCYWTDGSVLATRVRPVMRRVGANGTVVDAQPIGPVTLTSTVVGSVQMVWTGSRYIATMVRSVYTAERGRSLQDVADGILARPVGADLQPLGTEAIIVSAQPNTQTSHRAVAVPGGAYAVWQDDRSRANRDMYDTPNSDIYGARVTLVDGKITSSVAPLAGTIASESLPILAWDGARFTMFYYSSDQLGRPTRSLLHADAQGTPVGSPALLQFTDNLNDTRFFWNGSNFLLAWVAGDSGRLGGPAARRLSPEGALIDSQSIFLPNAGVPSYSYPKLRGVTLGQSFVLVWQLFLNQGQNPDNHDIAAAVVNGDGTLPSSTATVVAGSPGGQDNPAVATDGTEVLVIWRDRSGSGPRILGARFDAGLRRLDVDDAVIAQATAPDTLSAPLVAWTGKYYAVVWARDVGGLTSFVGCLLGVDRKCLPGTEMSVPSDLPVLPSGSVPAGVDRILDPSITWSDAGGLLFYRRLDTAPFVNRERLFARPVVVGPAAPASFDAGSPGDRPAGDASNDAATQNDRPAGDGPDDAGAPNDRAVGDAPDDASAPNDLTADETPGGAAGAGGESGSAGTGGAAGPNADAGGSPVQNSRGCGCGIPADGPKPGTPFLPFLPFLPLVALLLVRRRRITVSSKVPLDSISPSDVVA